MSLTIPRVLKWISREFATLPIKCHESPNRYPDLRGCRPEALWLSVPTPLATPCTIRTRHGIYTGVPDPGWFCVNEYGSSSRCSMFLSSDMIHCLFKTGLTRVNIDRQSMEVVPLGCAEEYKRARILGREVAPRWY